MKQEILHILVVDDDRRMASTLSDILKFNNYQTTTAYSGTEALEKIQRSFFDCVITDVKMPDMNGVQLYEEIHKVQPGLPVILMTAYATEDLIHQGMEMGIIGVLNKPLDIHQLLSFLTLMDGEHIITIVDDDWRFCETLKGVLEVRGFKAAVITNPHLELTQVLEDSQIVLLDLKLNSVSGIEFLKNIRESQSDLPVILVTGYRQEMTLAIQKAFEYKFDACMYKPLIIHDLIQKLAEIRSNRFRELLRESQS